MSEPLQAVILAAGRGSRMADETERVPKALLPIGPRTVDDPTPTCFLRRQCELLHRLGCEQIVVVVGYRHEAVRGESAGWGLKLDLVLNPTEDISRSGSMHSLQFAALSDRGVLDGRHQTLMMDADIVYGRAALERLMAAPARDSALLVASRYTKGDEEVLVYGAPDRPRWLGKGLTAALTGGAPCIGEATGIVKLAPADHDLVRDAMAWFLGDPAAPAGSLARRGFGPARQATEHEELTQHLMHLGRIRCVVLEEGVPFMEVDTREEYTLLREELYPRLLASDAEAEDRR